MKKSVHSIVIIETDEGYLIEYQTPEKTLLLQSTNQTSVKNIVGNLVLAAKYLSRSYKVINRVSEFEGALWLDI